MSKKNTNKLKNRTKKRTKKLIQQGGANLSEDYLIVDPIWRNGWTTIVKATNCQLFGTSMPLVTNLPNRPAELMCFQTFAFYQYKLGIKKMISMQACAGGIQPGGAGTCKLNNRNMEDKAWNDLKHLHMNHMGPDIIFSNEYIRDMTCGSLTTWSHIQSINFTHHNNRTMVHCLAGFGRTGIQLLTGILKHTIPTMDHRLFFGYPDGNTFITALIALMTANIRIVDHTDVIPAIAAPAPGSRMEDIFTNINQGAAHIPHMIQEVFNISDNFHATLFVQRLNLMLISIANFYQYQGQFYLFECINAGYNGPLTYNDILSRYAEGTLQGIVDPAVLAATGLII